MKITSTERFVTFVSSVFGITIFDVINFKALETIQDYGFWVPFFVFIVWNLYKFYMNIKQDKIRNSLHQRKEEKLPISPDELTESEEVLWRDRKKRRAEKGGTVKIESEFPGWRSGVFWTGNSYDALDKLAGQDVNLICVEMPFGNYTNAGYILKRKRGHHTGYICGKNRLCNCNYETKEEILKFHSDWNACAESYEDNLEALENYPDVRHVLENQIPEFRYIDDLNREIHFSSKARFRFLNFSRFFFARKAVKNNSFVYDYCEGAACSVLRMFFILEKVQKIKSNSGHVLLFCDPRISECIKLLADKIFPENSFVGDVRWWHRVDPLNDPDDPAMASRNNRDGDVILHYCEDFAKRMQCRDFLASDLHARTTVDTYRQLFYRILHQTSNRGDKILVLSNARSEICRIAETANLEWMEIQAFPSNLPRG